ncbi:hypothetical protein [Ramlibacter sp.]|uniref:hypothetical protein n=1 Tax=Ramlibacter sp. TaxID=1917967 RepID=UPI00184CA697|nr:hypothetical protein [Ramlibacter sp.]MBA2676219.1 hypothetical protein [Ramlibacter sp.]
MLHKTILPIALLLAGCATSSPTPDYDLRFGDALRDARARQTLNPAAASIASTPGMDGRAAREALILYQGTFRQPPPVVNVINIGGATGSSGK